MRQFEVSRVKGIIPTDVVGVTSMALTMDIVRAWVKFRIEDKPL